MIICICGENKYKNILINKFNEMYKDNILVCDYFSIKFNSIIETEKYKYELLESSVSLEIARLEYKNIVDKTVKNKMKVFFKNYKNKIILLINDNVLNKDFYETEFFKNSDIKILITDNILDNEYNKSLFDIVSKIDNIDVKRLVKV